MLVNKPFNKWKKAIETFYHHSATQFHKKSEIFNGNFINTYTKLQPDIRQQLDSARALQISENRKKLVPIKQTIILYGRIRVSTSRAK